MLYLVYDFNNKQTKPPCSGLQLQISAFRASGVPHKRHGLREQSELLQRVPLHWKGWKTLA